MRSRFALATLIAVGLCAHAPAEDARQRFGPDVTIYCSFDRTPGLKLDGEIKIPPCAHGRRDWLQAGRGDLYPRVEHSVTGQPLLLQRCLAPVPGKFGQAVRHKRLGRRMGTMLVFDAMGALFPQRGTVAAWVRWEKDCPPYRTSGPIFLVTCLRQPGSRSAYLGATVVRGHTFRVGVADRFGEWHGVNVATASLDLKQGRWHHFALAWDNLYGVAFYVDGKLKGGNWGADRWHTLARLDALSVGNLHRPSLEREFGGPGSWSPKTIMDVDELVAFRRALTAGEVAELCAKGHFTPRPGPSLSPAQFLAHRREMFGWGRGDGLPEFGPFGAGLRSPAVVSQVGVLDGQALKIGTRTPVDGQWFSRWPLLYHDYSVGGEELRLRLAPRSSYNYVRMAAPKFEGTLGYKKRRGRGKRIYYSRIELARLRLEANPFRRVRLDAPCRYAPLLVMRKLGSVNMIDLFSITPASKKRQSLRGLTARRMTMQAPVVEPWADPPKGRRLGPWTAAARFADSADRGLVRLSPGAGSDVPLRAGRFLHFESPAAKARTVYSGFELDWRVAKLGAEPARFWLAVWEPVLYERFLTAFDWKLVPRGGGEQRMRLRFAVPGVVLLPGQRLRLSVLCDRDATLAKASSVTLHETHAKDAVTAYYESQVGMVKDIFGQCSEPRRWSMAGQPYNSIRQIGRMLAYLETLGRIQPDDWRGGALWRFLNYSRRSMGPWENYAPAKECYPATVKLPTPPKDCPEWAFWWREAYKDLRFVVDWWIDNRQIDNGELGGGYNDDTDMVHEWANFHMLDPAGGKYSDSFSKLADFCYDQSIDGLNYRPKDSDLHCYEDGINVISACILFRYGDPFYYNRALVSAQHTDGNLTALNAKGQRLHRFMSYDGLGRTRSKPIDTGIFFRMEPAMWLTWYNRPPTTTRLLMEWMDTRLAYYPAKGPGLLPGEIRFKDGKDLGSAKSYMGFIDWNSLYLLARITGEPKYLRPMIDNLKMTAAGKGQRSYNYSHRLWVHFARFDAVGKAPWWPKVVKQMNREAQSPFDSPDKPATRKAVVEALKAACLRVRDLRGYFTWVEQSPDRVFMPYPRDPFYRISLGGHARVRNVAPLPQHSVSYENADADVARWVLEDTFDTLKIAFYSFHKKPRRVVIRPWALRHGEYGVYDGLDLNGDFAIDMKQPRFRRMVLRRYETPVALTLPPRRVHVLDVRLAKPLPEVFDRADVAISSKDVQCLPFLSAVRIPVHNIGRKPAENVVVQVADAATGRVLWKRVVKHIDWPADLAPKTVNLFTGPIDLKGVRRLRVTLDPEGKIEDFTRANNSVEVEL